MCSRQIIFLAATASKAWEPLSVAVAGDVSYVFATALVLCEAMKLVLLLPAVLLSSARAGRGAGVSWRAAALHYGLPSLLLAICNLGLGYAVPRLGALLYQVVFQVSTVAATGALAVALLGQRLTAGQWGALGLLTLAGIGAAQSRLGDGKGDEAPPSADGLLAALIGALALSLSTVLSERTASHAGAAIASRPVPLQADMLAPTLTLALAQTQTPTQTPTLTPAPTPTHPTPTPTHPNPNPNRNPNPNPNPQPGRVHVGVGRRGDKRAAAAAARPRDRTRYARATRRLRCRRAVDRRGLDCGCRPLDDCILHGRWLDMVLARRGHSATAPSLPHQDARARARAFLRVRGAPAHPGAQPRLPEAAQKEVSPRRPPRERSQDDDSLRLDPAGMVDGLGANAYSVSRCLAMAATPPLAVLALGTRVSAGFIAASGAVAVGGYLYARYQPGARLNAARERTQPDRKQYSPVPGDDDVTTPLAVP